MCANRRAREDTEGAVADKNGCFVRSLRSPPLRHRANRAVGTYPFRRGDSQHRRRPPADRRRLARPRRAGAQGRPRSPDLATPGGHRRQAALHRRRPRGPRGRRLAAGLRRRSCAACARRCTPTARGRSASTRASRPPRSRTPSTARTSPPGRWACRSPSTSRRTAATTATTRASSATSARPASRSTRSRT